MEYLVQLNAVSFNFDIIFFVQSNFVFVSFCSVIFVLSIATVNFLLVKVCVTEQCISFSHNVSSWTVLYLLV